MVQGLKTVLLSVTLSLFLIIVWNSLTSSPEVNKINQLSTQLENLTRINKDLYRRIETLEDDLLNAQSSFLHFETRINQLEQQPLKTSSGNSQQELLEQQHKPDSPHTPRIKPPTVQDQLLAAQIPLGTIQRIQQLVGQNRLASLELRDQAIREDWMDTPEYIEKQQQLPATTEGIREEFGDQVFDQYLYASGRPNRIMVREVYAQSAADNAGIQPQDILLSYASNRLFSMSELQRLTTQGIAGEPVLIEILRDGLPFTTSAPRGPLGISMTVSRKKPE